MRAVFLFILVPTMALADFPVDMPFNPQNSDTIDYSRTVRIGNVTNYTIIGLADYGELSEYVKPYGLELTKGLMGKAQMALNFSFWTDVEGCDCPPEFSEFTLTYQIEDQGVPAGGKAQFIPDFLTSSHPERIASLLSKFGTFTRMGTIERSKKTLTAKSENGEIDISVTAKLGIPNLFLMNETSNAGFHSLGLPHGSPSVFYRLWGKGKMALSVPFLFKVFSKVSYDKNSALGQHLEHIKFKPVVWAVIDTDDAWSWLPY